MRIYDDATELNFTNANIAKGGWKQRGPELGPNGYVDLREKITLTWTDLDDDTRAAILQDMGLLSRKAVITNSPERPEFYHRAKAVVIEGRTPSESEARYAILRSLASPQLHELHQSSGGPLKLGLDLEREGLWRGIQPGATGHQVISETVQNYTYQTNRNYVTIAPSAIPGDAPALARIQVSISGANLSLIGSNSRLWLTRRVTDSLAELDDYNPYFWLERSIGSGTNPLIKTVAGLQDLNGYTPEDIPGDRVAEVHYTDADYADFTFSLTDLAEEYAGVHNVWAVYRCEAAGGGQLSIFHGPGTYDGHNSLGSVPTEYAAVGAVWLYLYLGNINIPVGGIVGGLGSSNYELVLRVRGGHPSTTYYTHVAGIFLQPLSDQVYTANPALEVVADGDLRKSWLSNSAGTDFQGGNLQAEGDYIELEPGRYNRIFVNAIGLTAYPAITYNVKISIIPRYQYLRGAETW